MTPTPRVWSELCEVLAESSLHSAWQLHAVA